MSLHSAYGFSRYVEVTFKDETYTTIAIDMPLELIGSYDDVTNVFTLYDESKQSNLQKEYVRNWINRNLQNVKETIDDWDE